VQSATGGAITEAAEKRQKLQREGPKTAPPIRF